MHNKSVHRKRKNLDTDDLRVGEKYEKTSIVPIQHSWKDQLIRHLSILSLLDGCYCSGIFLLGSVAIIFGRVIGYEIAVWCCIGLAIVITIVFLSIIIFNLLAIFAVALAKRLYRH
jgi:hypothetical protein